jgi:polyferredoxin
MPINSIELFIQSPYNRFADIKMFKFFTQISITALLVLVGLLLLSICIQNFWCRYLCPYGALLGLIGLFSMGKIHRHPSSCTECGKCEKSCPGMIPIRQKILVHSTECYACLACIESCPEKDTIQFSLFNGKKSFTSGFIVLILLLLFFGGITLAKLTGNWQNKITTQEYLSYVSSESKYSG